MVLSETKQRLLDRFKSGTALRAPEKQNGIPRRTCGNVAPQSFNQEQVWTHVQMMGPNPAYNELVVFHRHGSLDLATLERTLDELNRRHEIWRTTFEMGEDEPVQIIHDSAPPVKLPFFDLRSLPSEERSKEALRMSAQESRTPFDLKKLSLWRGFVVRIGDEEYQFHMNLHQLVLDGMSVYRVMLPELIAIYEAFAQGNPSPLPESGAQYADYAVWQRRTLTSEAMAPDLTFWKQTLANPAPPLSWPNVKPRPDVQSYHGALEMLTVPTESVDRMQAFASSQSATLFMTLATGFYVLLHRYTGQTDITLGTPLGSRTPETEHILGYLLNMVPVRVDLSGNPSFSESLNRVRTSFLEAMDHGTVPLLRLLREIRPAYDPSRNPLFQIMISMEPPMPPINSAWDLTQSGASSGSTKMDMYLNFETRPNGLVSPILYNPDLLDPSDVHRMFADLRAILDGAMANPTAPIAELVLPKPAPVEQPKKRGFFRRLLGN